MTLNYGTWGLAGFTLHGASGPIPIFFPSQVAHIGIVTWMCKQEKNAWIEILSDLNQSFFTCGNKLDLIRISARSLVHKDFHKGSLVSPPL